MRLVINVIIIIISRHNFYLAFRIHTDKDAVRLSKLTIETSFYVCRGSGVLV